MPPVISTARPSAGASSFKTAGSGGRVSGPRTFKPPRPQASKPLEVKRTGKRTQEQIEIYSDSDDLMDAGEAPARRRPTKKQETSRVSARAMEVSDEEERDGKGEEEEAEEENENEDEVEHENEDENENNEEKEGDVEEQRMRRSREGGRVIDLDQQHTFSRELLTHAVHHFFEKPGTRITEDANAALGYYFDLFVTEAVHRAMLAQPDGFLDTDVLKKLALVLIMDM